jgi:hypothetical protein
MQSWIVRGLAVGSIDWLGVKMMLLNPLWRPAIYLYVVNESLVLLECALPKLVSASSVCHQMIVTADVFVEPAANVSERSNQMIQSTRVGVNENLISICICRETQGEIWLLRRVGIDLRSGISGAHEPLRMKDLLNCASAACHC